MLPRWYKHLLMIWVIAAPAFWWFASAFNGASFFSLPKLAGPSEGAGWQISLIIQLAIYAALLAPITSAPWLVKSRRHLNENDYA